MRVAITHSLSHVVQTFILKRICIFHFHYKMPIYFWVLQVKGFNCLLVVYQNTDYFNTTVNVLYYYRPSILCCCTIPSRILE